MPRLFWVGVVKQAGWCQEERQSKALGGADTDAEPETIYSQRDKNRKDKKNGNTEMPDFTDTNGETPNNESEGLTQEE